MASASVFLFFFFFLCCGYSIGENFCCKGESLEFVGEFTGRLFILCDCPCFKLSFPEPLIISRGKEHLPLLEESINLIWLRYDRSISCE
uniref:Putative secreted protein n=1 Tax=Panstrongylus lignarius TaxID=156445 RepID=A0A224Y2E8_9HEMI